MGLIDSISQNLVGLSIPPPLPSEYNLELIDNVIVNILANQNKAPYELIKERAKNEGLMDANLNTQLTTKRTKHSACGQLQSDNQIQFHSKSAHKQSVLSQ